jgi:hypothetical protein
MEATCSSMYCTSARQFSLSWEQLCRVIAKQRGEDTHDSFRAVVVVYAVADQILKNLRRIGARVVWLIKLADVAAAGNVYSAKVGQNSHAVIVHMIIVDLEHSWRGCGQSRVLPANHDATIAAGHNAWGQANLRSR